MPYITYLLDRDNHTNAMTSHAGWGETKEESIDCSFYHGNQLPWVRTVAASRAPKWAKREAWTPRRHQLECKAMNGERLTKAEQKELDQFYLD